MKNKNLIVLAVLLSGIFYFNIPAIAQEPDPANKTVNAKAPGKDPNAVGFYKGDRPGDKEEKKTSFSKQREGREGKEKQSLYISPLYIKMIQTLLIFFIGYFLLFVLVRIINRSISDLKTRHLTRKRTIYFMNGIILILTVFVWLEHMSSVTVFISVVGAGIALALQEVLLCIAGWCYIVLRDPFEVGDRIELGGVKGDVIDIRVFQTALLEIGNWVESDQSTGRIVNIPNSSIFKKETFNYNQGFEFIWNEIKVIITFESSWEKAEAIMLEEAEKVATGKEDIIKQKIDYMTRKYMIKYGKLTPIVYTEIKDSGVELSLRYLTEAKKRRVTQDALNRAILEAFAKEPGVDFAYTTYRIVK